MPVDIQCVYPQEIIKINRVRNAPGMPVRTLDVIGDDFRAVTEVLVNDVQSPSYVVLSRTRMLVQVPPLLEAATVTSIVVLSRVLTLTQKSFIRFGFGQTVGKVSGILRLMQLFLKVLMTTPGTDIFAPKVGGGALVHLGQNIGTEDGSDVVSDFIVSVDRAARQIVQIQGRNQATPPDERLLSAKVVSAGFNKNETAIVASIELSSQAGRTAIARLEL